MNLMIIKDNFLYGLFVIPLRQLIAEILFHCSKIISEK